MKSISSWCGGKDCGRCNSSSSGTFKYELYVSCLGSDPDGDEPTIALDSLSASTLPESSALSARKRTAFPPKNLVFASFEQLLWRMSEPTRSSPSGKG